MKPDLNFWIDRLETRRLFAASIRGSVLNDTNANGTIDSGEVSPIGTSTIWADLDYDGVLDAGEPSTTSLSSSSYTLSLSSGGTYLVRCSVPAGYISSVPQTGWQLISVNNGFSVLGVNFGAFQSGRTAATPFDDLNDNGALDSSEAMNRTTVWADLDNDGTLDSNEPASGTVNGTPGILDIRPGTYRVRTQTPPGRVNVSLPNGFDQTIVGGIASSTTYVPMQATRNISGTAYIDADGNEKYSPGDQPLVGATAFVDINSNGVADSSEPSAITNSAGAYLILSSSIPSSGTIRLREPGGALNSGAPSYTALATTIDIGPFDFFRRVTNVATGQLFVDTNNNGVKDSGEASALGMTVFADLDNDTVLDTNEPTVFSDYSGSFVFAVPNGTYSIRVLASNGYAPIAGAGAFASRTYSGTARVSLGALGVSDTLTSRAVAAFDGTVFVDANRNARRDAGETGFTGGVAFIDRDGDGDFDVGETNATLDTTGRFLLSNLSALDNNKLLLISAGPGWRSSTLGSVTGNKVIVSNFRFIAEVAVFAAPDVGISSFTFDVDDRQAIDLVFTHDLGKSLQAGDFTLEMLFNGGYVPTQALFSLDAVGVINGQSVATLHPSQILPDGKYRMVLRPNALADAGLRQNSVASTFDFQVLAGDANHDRAVNFDDLLILAQNYGQSGKTFSQGNFNYSADGKVDFDDLLIVAQKYNTALPALAAAPATKRKARLGLPA